MNCLEALKSILSEQLNGFVRSLVMPAYKYSPIVHEGHIRLLELDPGFGELSGLLKTVSLSQTPPFQALSYTWGAPVFSDSIRCSPNSHIAITSNLGAALRRLRHPLRKRTLWIDAICVDQRNVLERNEQVRHMRKIYEKADEVQIWLGEDSGDARLAFKGLNKLLKRILAAEKDDDLTKTRQRIVSEFSDAKPGLALANLLKCSWFRRIWVIQEVTCARHATLCCGVATMDWEKFTGIIRDLYVGGIPDSLEGETQWLLYHLASLDAYRQAWKHGRGWPMPVILNVFRRCEASDIRDKIFALVGLANQGATTASQPDYTKDVAVVYRDWALNAIITDKNVDVLKFCSLPDVNKKHLPVPTWTPDWSRPMSFNPISVIYAEIYDASKSTEFKGVSANKEQTLLLDGLLLNQVETITRPWHYRSGLNPDDRNVKTLEILAESEILFNESELYKGQDRSRFSSALTGDVDNAAHRVGEQDLSTAYRLYFQECKGIHPINKTDELKMRDFEGAFLMNSADRAFCRFDDGRVGWVPDKTEVGDQVVIFLGAHAPILLRPRGSEYIVIGNTYVDGMMDGQAFEGPDVKIETIALI